MKMFKALTLSLFAALMALAFTAAPAQAQATRTWVSGVGDDVNPCSRTAPCKTFAGAISKTAAGGEIDCLDPGGFGTVTITKSITLDCTGTLGSILAAGTNGVNVNDSATATPNTIKVILRGITIQGAGTGFIGVNFTSGASLTIVDCIVQNFNASTATGIRVTTNGTAKLTVRNTDVVGNGTVSGGSGIEVAPAGGTVKTTLDTVSLLNNGGGNGLRINTTGGSATTVVQNADISHNGQGIAAVTGGLFSNLAFVNASAISDNTTGIVANGSVRVRVKNTVITGNTTGINPAGGSFIDDLGGNGLAGNTTDGTFN